MVGAIGFEPSLPQRLVALAGLWWQPKDRNGSQRGQLLDTNWTLIGHCGLFRATNSLERFHVHNHSQIANRSVTERAKSTVCRRQVAVRLNPWPLCSGFQSQFFSVSGKPIKIADDVDKDHGRFGGLQRIEFRLLAYLTSPVRFGELVLLESVRPGRA